MDKVDYADNKKKQDAVITSFPYQRKKTFIPLKKSSLETSFFQPAHDYSKKPVGKECNDYD
jgi:hypothetical protein